MEITRQADYAVRAVFDLARRAEGERAFTQEIAGRQGILQAFLTKVFSRLATKGIVRTQRDVKGGVRSVRAADEITLLRAVEAVDGPITPNRCTRQPSDCPLDPTCVVHPFWQALCADLRAHLDGIDCATQVASAASTPVQLDREVRTSDEVPVTEKRS